MKLKTLTTLALLFVLGVSVVHEYAVNFHECSHCDVKEYLSKFESPIDHCDNCIVHIESHQPFLLSQNIFMSNLEYKPTSNEKLEETYKFKIQLEFYKPPTA
jgi:hypothetical protein